MLKEDETVVGRIGHSMTIFGSVEADGHVVLEGKIEGSFSGTTLFIGESGALEGQVEATSIECAGQIEGTVTTGSFKLRKSGHHTGTAETEKLEVEPGAILDCILQSGLSKPSGVHASSSKTERAERLDFALENYLDCFDEQNRPCCYEVPWSQRSELYAQIVETLDKKKPLIKVTGDVGMGKTTLVAKLFKDLPEKYIPLKLDTQTGSVADILEELVLAMGIDKSATKNSQHDLLDIVKDCALQNSLAGKRFVLLIDDSHLMYHATLEGVVRLLSGASEADYDGAVEDDRLQLLLFTTPELEQNTVTTINEYFEDETNCQFFLEPLSLKDLADYIRLALQLASQGDTHAVMSVYPNEAIQKIRDLSHGNIAEINRLAGRGLQLACRSGLGAVSANVV